MLFRSAPIFGLPSDVYILLAEGPDLDRLLEATEAVSQRAATELPGLVFQPPSVLMPSKAAQDRTARQVREARLSPDAVTTALDRAGEEAGFKPGTFRAFADRLPKPVIVAGGGVKHSGAGRELVALAEALQIPVVTSLNGKDTIPGVHPLSCGVVGTYSRESANKVVNAADLVCFIGTTTGGMTTNFWAVPKIGTPSIQIDIDPEALGMNYPLQARVQGDAKVTLTKMLAACDKSTAGKRKAWVAEAQAFVKEWYAKYKPLLESDQMPIHPARMCHELSKHVPDDAIVCVDTGHAGMWMGGMYDLRTDKQSYMRSAGHLGWAFPAGLGAKCGAPERPVVTFTGDAGFWYHIGDIETAVRWKINAVTVVNNNGGGNQSKRGFDRVYGGEQTAKGRELWTFRKTNFARIAEEIGALGLRVERASEIPEALRHALEIGRAHV